MAPSRERLISSRSNKLGKEDFFVISSLKGLGCKRSSTHLIQTRSMTKLVYRNVLGLLKRKRKLREQRAELNSADSWKGQAAGAE
jgi:hypothetical protein